MKKGFTLSELMIALVVLGVMCAAVMPVIVKNMPNQRKIMVKRAYYITTNTVKELINNPIFYPTIDENGVVYEQPFKNTSEVTYDGKTYSGTRKFMNLFATYINQVTITIGATCSSSYCHTFSTTEGFKWTIGTDASNTDFKILVDTNGDKKPNCYQGNEENSCKNRTKDFDQFTMIVYPDGKVEVSETDLWAKEVIIENSNITE